ncbi:hypothetical protein F7661_16715 [Pseudomonas sp. CFA]|nr:hypothetical protein F7661_16715 [Pseudomonas sp. CFA]
MLFHGLALAAVGFFEHHRGTVMPRRGRVHRLHRPCRSGFTREYGSRDNGERQVEIGQQARPFRG